MTAHSDNASGSYLFGGEHSKEANCAITNDDCGTSWLHIRGMCCKPAGTHDVGECQETWDHIVWRDFRSRHQRAIGQRHAEQRCLRRANPLAMLTGRLIAELTVWTSIVRRGERTDHKLSRFNVLHRAANILDNAAILVSHRSRLRNRVNSPVGPQVRTAHTRC